MVRLYFFYLLQQVLIRRKCCMKGRNILEYNSIILNTIDTHTINDVSFINVSQNMFYILLFTFIAFLVDFIKRVEVTHNFHWGYSSSDPLPSFSSSSILIYTMCIWSSILICLLYSFIEWDWPYMLSLGFLEMKCRDLLKSNWANLTISIPSWCSTNSEKE